MTSPQIPYEAKPLVFFKLLHFNSLSMVQQPTIRTILGRKITAYLIFTHHY